MKTTRRGALLGSLATASAARLSVCGEGGATSTLDAGKRTKVCVMGAIHSGHRTSRLYSLKVLERAVRALQPDMVLSEIPPDRIKAAKRSFAETGKVTESRTRAFPELTDVIFPLSQEMGFQIVATAGWTQAIADNRRAKLADIRSDPARAQQWAEHQRARAGFAKAVQGKGDDPQFIHTHDYDVLVQRAQTPYQIFFDRDLGPGGWTQINAAHTGLIGEALNGVRGQGLNILILFGTFHKYMIERSLILRDDIEFVDAAHMFA